MSDVAEKETRGFDADVQRVLRLVIDSLYSHKEIFLRELVSNAADAVDKLKFLALSDEGLYEGQTDPAIRITFDKDARTLTIQDDGIGMTRDEVVENLGTIARSGTRSFLDNMTQDQAKDSQLIGQFGVGFYSAFIVADEVVVETRRAGSAADAGVRWRSKADSNYELESIQCEKPGTSITLFLKADEDEFLSAYRLKSIIRKYSDYVSVPIKMLEEKMPAAEEDEESKPEEVAPVFETVNQAKPLWTRPKQELKDEDYEEFYTHIAHDVEKPLSWAHNRVEGGKLDYTSLLYLPAHPPFDLWNRDKPRGLKLYVQRTFIMDDAEQFLPNYLRFMKGVIDSNNFPLNISRELLQSDRTVDSMKSALVKRALTLLEKLAKDDSDKYAKFWESFGAVLKEGPVEDFANRERIAKLLRFASTHQDSEAQTTSLDDYIARMKPEQDKIYYVTAESYAAAKHSPHLELFSDKGVEVLLLTDRVDEWLTMHMNEYDGKSFQSVAKGDLDLSKLGEETSEEDKKEREEKYTKMIEQMKKCLGERVKDVRLTHRLKQSPACVVVDDGEISGHMQRMLQSMGQDAPKVAPVLEINPEHQLVQQLDNEADDDRFNEWSQLLLEQALLAEGGQLSDPAQFVQRMNRLLLSS